MISTSSVFPASRARVCDSADARQRSNHLRWRPRSRPRASARAALRPVARRSALAAGAWSGPATRIRSTSASGNRWSVSHTSQAISHSLGPRAPWRARNPSNAPRNGAAAGSARRRSSRPSSPASKLAVNSDDPATMRPRSQSSQEGSAEATSPRPPSRRSTRWVSPRRFSQTRRNRPRTAPAPPETSRWLMNIRPSIAMASSTRATSSSSEAVVMSGRDRRQASTSERSASMPDNRPPPSIENPYRMPRSVAHRLRSVRCGMCGGATPSEPRNVASVSAIVAPGVRTARTRDTDRFRYV